MRTKLIILAIFAITFACKKNKTKKEITKNEVNSLKYELNKENTTINFTAYKTTEKVAVNGRFTKFDLVENGKANSIKEALNNTTISIPINGIKTNETSRDYKIMKFFFGTMTETTALKGKLKLIDDKKASVDLTMNGITEVLDATYSIENDTFVLNTVLDINKWNAQESLNSLNNICKDLHKGKDGISKTWNEVTINITTKF